MGGRGKMSLITKPTFSRLATVSRKLCSERGILTLETV